MLAALLITAVASVRTAQAQELGPKWHPWFELGGYASDERARGEVATFAPLAQSANSLLFADVRGKLFEEDVYEGNFAIAGRTMLRNGNFGAWAGFDIRRSELGNTFRQVSGGLEFLTPNFDFRSNVYVPINDEAFVGSVSSSSTGRSSSSVTTGSGTGGITLQGTAVVTGGGAQTVTTTTTTTKTTTLTTKEFALHGVDGEVGMRLPLERWFGRGTTDHPAGQHRHELRLYGGGFYFDSQDTPEVAGPRARLEWRINDVIPALPGSRLTFEGEYQYDDVRKDQLEAGARLRIPFGGGGRAARAAAQARLTPQERRMMEGLERDTDIVADAKTSSSTSTTSTTTTTTTGAGAGGGVTPVTDAGSGQALNVFHIADTAQGAGDCSSPANACTAATALGLAGIGDIFVPVDVAGVIVANLPLNGARQQVVGGGNTGDAAIVLSDAAGSVLNLTGLGGRATVNGTVTTSSTNTIRGFDIANTTAGPGLEITGAVGATNPVSDITIQGVSAGVQFAAGSSGTVTFANDVTVNGTAGGPAFDVLGGTANATFSGNITQAANNDAVSVAGGHTGTLTFQTGTINATNGLGLQFDNADGTYNFNGTTTLNGTGGGTDTGIDITNGSAGTFMFGANTAITHNNAAAAFNVNTASNPNITYSGTINNTNGRAIAIQNTTAGANTITFDSAAANAIQDSGTGIFLNAVAQNVNFTADAELTGTQGVDIDGGSGTFTFFDTDINATGVAFDVNGGTSSVNFQAASTITQASNNAAVNVTGGHATGTLDFDGSINVTNGTGLQFNNADGIYRFDGTTTLNGGDAGIDILAGSTGTFTFGTTTSITNPTGTAVNIDNGDAALGGFTYSGNITNAAGRVVSIANVTNGAGNITFQTGTITDTGTGILINDVDEDVNFNGQANLNGTDGIDIEDGSSGAITFVNTDTNLTGGNALRINDNGGAAVTSAVTFGAASSITHTGTNTTAIDIQDHTTGLIDINALVTAATGTANAINLQDFTSTINLDGVLDIDTTTGTGFNATNGGTINVTAAGNTITTVESALNADDAGQAIVMNGVTIGGNNMTFATISATNVNAFNDALSFTTVGGGTFNGGNVTVTEGRDGIAISGSAATFNFTSATIDNTNDDGIFLNGANGTVTFTTVDIDGTDTEGIDIVGNTNAVNINGGTIGATTTTTGDAVNINGGTGNVTIAAAITNSSQRSADVTNRTGGTVNFTGTITDTGLGINLATNTGGNINFTALVDLDTTTNDAITLNGNNGANIDFDNVDIDTTTGNGIDATGANTNVDVSGTVDVATANNRAFEFTATSGNYDYSGVTSTQTGGVGGIGQVFDNTHSGTYNLGSHTVTSPGDHALNIGTPGVLTTINVTYESLTVAGTATADRTIQIDDTSGSLTINGGTLRSTGAGDLGRTIDLQNDGGIANSFTLTTAGVQFESTDDGIFAETTTAGSTLNVTVTGITAASNFGENAIEIEYDEGSGTVNIGGAGALANVIDSGSSTTGIIELDNVGTGTVTANITNTSISAGSTGEAIDIRSAGTGPTNVTITGGTITNVGDTAIDLSSSGVGSTLRASVSNVTINGTGSDGILVEAASTGEIDATLTNNTIQNLTAGSGVLVEHQVGSTGNICLNATGNSDGAAGPPSSGGAGNNAFEFNDNGTGATMDISQASLAALGAANTGGVGDVTVTNGTVTFNATCQTP